jgi:hypothetical protein
MISGRADCCAGAGRLIVAAATAQLKPDHHRIVILPSRLDWAQPFLGA